MSLEKLQPALSALSTLSGQEVHVSVGNGDAGINAYAEFHGVLGDAQIDGDHVWVPVWSHFPGERIGFSINAGYFEWWGQRDGAVRVHADGVGLRVRPVA
jgi:hypothetical protein